MSCHLYGFFLSISVQLDSAFIERKNVLHSERSIYGQREKEKFVRYNEGAEIYSMSVRKFQDLAKDAGAIYKVGKMALVNCEIFDRYMETFKL